MHVTSHNSHSHAYCHCDRAPRNSLFFVALNFSYLFFVGRGGAFPSRNRNKYYLFERERELLRVLSIRSVRERQRQSYKCIAKKLRIILPWVYSREVHGWMLWVGLHTHTHNAPDCSWFSHIVPSLNSENANRSAAKQHSILVPSLHIRIVFPATIYVSFAQNPISKPLFSTSLFPCDGSLRLKRKLVQNIWQKTNEHIESLPLCSHSLHSARWTHIVIYSVLGARPPSGCVNAWVSVNRSHGTHKCKRDF